MANSQTLEQRDELVLVALDAPRERLNQRMIMLVVLLANPKVFPLLPNLVVDEYTTFCYLLT